MPNAPDCKSVASVAQAAHAQARDEPVALGCTICGAPLAAGALFCGECGASVGPSCPGCDASVTDQDFCQACGHWLRPGDCRFCYEHVGEGAAFCPSCGEDQAGIACPGCGARNFFDFCSDCGNPLTEAAAESSRQIAADPVVADALRKLKETPSIAATPIAADGSVPAPGLDTAPPVEQRTPRGGLFSTEQRQALLNLSSDIGQRDRELRLQTAREAEKQREISAHAHQQQAQAEQRRADLQVRRDEDVQLARNARALVERSIVADMIKELQSRTFASQQEARRFFMALQSPFSKVGMSVKGWRCNRYGNVHSDPNRCAAPQFGGVWLVD